MTYMLIPASQSSLHGSAGDMKSWDDVIHCNLISTAHPHQQPINLLKAAGGRVVTGSQDHTLKVHTLHGSVSLHLQLIPPT